MLKTKYFNYFLFFESTSQDSSEKIVRPGPRDLEKILAAYPTRKRNMFTFFNLLFFRRFS